MNTIGLTKHYSTLTAEERLSLSLAAGARDDRVEQERLAHTAPMVDVSVPHTFPRAMAFREVMEWHRMEQLELAALYFRSVLLAVETGDTLKGSSITAYQLYGYLLRTFQAGWVRFCKRVKLVPDQLLSELPGSELLRQALEVAENTGFTDVEADAYLRSTVSSDVRIRTAASIELDLMETFEARITWWSDRKPA